MHRWLTDTVTRPNSLKKYTYQRMNTLYIFGHRSSIKVDGSVDSGWTSESPRANLFPRAVTSTILSPSSQQIVHPAPDPILYPKVTFPCPYFLFFFISFFFFRSRR